MNIDWFRHDDVDVFLELAAAEGWICDRWEFDFLLRTFPLGCLVERANGRAVAFVTSIKYGRSGWIGNLLVREELRGKGSGAALMQEALNSLVEAGAETVWLTASEQGKSIYERLGFVAIDTIKRWTGLGREGDAAVIRGISTAQMVVLDQAGWGDRREAIIAAVAERGMVCGGYDGFLVAQPLTVGIQVGPWGCSSREAAAKHLDKALATAGAGTRVFLDVPVRNVAASALLYARGFRVNRTNTLMYLGHTPDYNPEHVYALASMGSMG
jgi:ribosomal protein S18 acetylase RimI-like enzyme